jgi:uncharacterized protein (DUF885 family)
MNSGSEHREFPSVEPDVPKDASGPVKAVWELYARAWDAVMEKDPITATMIGDHRFNDQLQDLSKRAYELHARNILDFQQQLEAINFSDLLDEKDQQNYLYLQKFLQFERMKLDSFKRFELPTSHMFGPHVMFPQLATFHPFGTKADFESFIKRIKAFPSQVDQMVEGFREGIRVKITHPTSSVTALIKQCQNQIKPSPQESPLYGPFTRAKKAEKAPLSVEQLDQLEAEVVALIESLIFPAYAKLQSFLETEYMPQARKEAGIWVWPDGDKIYNLAIHFFTSLPLTAEKVHNLGQEEVARIKSEMETIKEKVGSPKEEDLKAFMERIKGDSRFYYATGEEIIQEYKRMLKTAEAKLPQFFGILPKAAYDIRAIEPFREQNAPPAHYYPPPSPVPGSTEPSRPGIFYANTYKPETRPNYVMESIALHEGVPGHHLQIALAQELEGLPRARKQPADFCTGFIEGWGLYTEKLGLEMGFYQDPYSDFGRLTTEMMRAVRLVVDTGLHAFRWTREQAIKYFGNHSAMSTTDIEAEVDRYMVFPGQALSYKIGEQTILRMRKTAEEALGKAFDIRAFHDATLKYGSLPLETYEHNIHQFIKSQLN